MSIDFKGEAGKAAAKSTSVLGAAFAILTVVVFQILGVEIPVGETEALKTRIHDLIVNGGVILGSLAAIWGRIKASEKIAKLF